MYLTKENKEKIFKEHGGSEKNTGSAEGQIALFTKRINHLTDHLKKNRKDFNIRMQQFFDHYLKGESKPMWMVRGVPAIEKGINQGYELQEN